MTVVLFSSSMCHIRVFYILQQNSITVGPVSVFLISHSLLVWDSILESWHVTHLGLWWLLCVQGPKDFFEDFNKVALIGLCLIESAWITPCPALYYKHSSFDSNSSFYDFFSLLLLNCYSLHCLWLVDLPGKQINKKSEGAASEYVNMDKGNKFS